MNNHEAAINALKEIVKADVRILDDPARFMAHYNDLAHDSKRDGMMLQMALMQGVHKFFKSGGDSSEALKKCRDSLDGMLADDAIEFIAEALCVAFGMSYLPTAPKKPAESDIMTVDEMYEMGENFWNGKNGFSSNQAKAFKWFSKAAERGHLDAMVMAGICCMNGKGAKKDEFEAFGWFSVAADKGQVEAQYWLAVCYAKGIGTGQSNKDAEKWIKESAKNGYHPAQLTLASCYEKGKCGIVQNYAMAAYWYVMSGHGKVHMKEIMEKLSLSLPRHMSGIFFQENI